MKAYDRLPFRSVDEWKSALMTLPDNNFFELLRSVFGNIKTPFNKQRLLDDLFMLLSRDEICKTIAAFIDEQDHKIIAAVALLDEPAPGELESFFTGEFNCAELHSQILNLEERLILYRFRDEGILRLALNPVIEAVLVPFITDTRILFPTFALRSSSPNDSIVRHENSDKKNHLPIRIGDGCVFAALFAFIYSEEEALKMDSGAGFRRSVFDRAGFCGLRKKFLDEGKRIFPELDLELAVRILIQLGLFRSDGASLVPCREKIAEFGRLFPNERQEYWAAGFFLCLDEAEYDAAESNDPAANGNLSGDIDSQTAVSGFFPSGQSFLSRNRLRRIALFIHDFMGNIENGREYPEITLRRIGELLVRKDAGIGSIGSQPGFQPWSSGPFNSRARSLRTESPESRLSFGSFLTVLERTGLLERGGAGWIMCGNVSVSGSPPAAAAGISDNPVIVMDTAFSFVLYPEISFADALALAIFCSVKEPVSESAIRFEISRQSAVRGFDQELGSDIMLELLNRLSFNRLDNNLAWTLKDWENRYAEVSLYQGTVLCLAENRRYLAETRPLASQIRRTLAPGVYLLAPGDRAEVTRALRRAGVDIVAQPPCDVKMEGGLSGFTESYHGGSFPRLGSYTESHSAFPLAGNNDKKAGEDDPAGSIKEKFRQVLMTMKLTKQERDELEARIERRLVLNETQLVSSTLRYEKLEARGIDYQGKTSIAKQAISAGSLLEVSWPAAGGETRRVLGIPVALEKKEKESILVLKNFSSVEGEGSSQKTGTISIPLGKISLLRRVKRSIFGE